MQTDFLGWIGGLEFVTAEQAFKEAVEANKRGEFGQYPKKKIQKKSLEIS